MIFDTHAHYDDERFDEDRQAVLSALQAGGVGYVINIGADMESSRASIALAEQYDFLYAAVGIHPEGTLRAKPSDIEELREMLSHPKVVALGEIGLDYHYDDRPVELQKEWFRRQAELAVECDVPVIIHDREAHGDCMDLVRAMPALRGVFHCYSGSVEMADELVKRGFYLAFGGTVTFSNAKAAPDVARKIAADRFLIETDCPYLAPVPHRGERNSSLLLPLVVKKLAELRQTTPEEIIQQSESNALRLFSKIGAKVE